MANLAIYPVVKRQSDTFRTTLTLERELYEFVDTYARANALKFNEAVGKLVQTAKRALMPEKEQSKGIEMVKKNGAYVFVLPPLSKGQKYPQITSEQVKDMLEE